MGGGVGCRGDGGGGGGGDARVYRGWYGAERRGPVGAVGGGRGCRA